MISPKSRAQQQTERTLDEIKAEAIKRAENGMYPLIGLDPAEVREAFAKINTTDNDEWAAAFSSIADRYMSEGNSLKSSNPVKADAKRAGWPSRSSAGANDAAAANERQRASVAGTSSG